MIGKLIGGYIGAKAAERSSKVGGSGGALLGIAATTLLRRLSWPALIALAAGGYALKRMAANDDEAPAGKRKPAARKTARKPAKKPRKAATA